jgi:hypothetical protein
MKVTAISPGADDPRESGTRTVFPDPGAAALNTTVTPLLSESLVNETAEFFVAEGYVPSDLLLFAPSAAGRARVMSAMARLQAARGVR